MEELNEKDSQNNKKNGSGMVVVIALLVIVIIGLVGYICYDKGILLNSNKEVTSSNKKSNKTSVTKKVEKTEEENVTFSDSELQKYVDYITPVRTGVPDILYNISSVDVKNLSTAEKIDYIGSLVYSKHTSSSDYRYDILSENDVKSSLEEVYGPNSYKRETFKLGCGDFTFNESDNNYYSLTGCGGATATMAGNVIIDYKATKSKLEITTAYGFVDGETSKMYKDYNKTVSLGDYSGSGNVDEFKDYIKNNKEKFNTLVYTFESTDGSNYYFTGLVNNM